MNDFNISTKSNQWLVAPHNGIYKNCTPVVNSIERPVKFWEDEAERRLTESAIDDRYREIIRASPVYNNDKDNSCNSK